MPQSEDGEISDVAVNGCSSHVHPAAGVKDKVVFQEVPKNSAKNKTRLGGRGQRIKIYTQLTLAL